jgi:dipeptidase
VVGMPIVIIMLSNHQWIAKRFPSLLATAH